MFHTHKKRRTLVSPANACRVLLGAHSSGQRSLGMLSATKPKLQSALGYVPFI